MALSANEIGRFNPGEHITKLKNKDYLEVKWRLVWFRDSCPNGRIATSIVHIDVDKGIAVFKAVIEDSEGGHAEGHGSETAKDFLDYIEKAETKAIGRALAALGYGTQFAPELEEGERPADSPVSRQRAAISEQQLSSIRKLCEQLGKPEPEGIITLTFENARKVIQQLTTEYKETRAKQGGQTQITAASIRTRVDEIKPSIKDGDTVRAMTLEEFYKNVCKKEFESDDAITPDDCAKMTLQLDTIVQARANRAKQPA